MRNARCASCRCGSRGMQIRDGQTQVTAAPTVEVYANDHDDDDDV